MTQSRDQFENVMRKMISRLGFDADDVTGVSRESTNRKLQSPMPSQRQQSHVKASPRHAHNINASPVDLHDSDSDDNVSTPRASRGDSARSRRRPSSRTRMTSPSPYDRTSGATTPQAHVQNRLLLSPAPPPRPDAAVASPPRLPLRRKSARSRRLVLDSMRVSPNSLDEEEELEMETSKQELPPISGGSQPKRSAAVGRFVEESNQLLRNRSSHLQQLPQNNSQRENSFTTISDLTRKAGRKSMHS